jgi:hypothetical protein
MIPTVIAQIPSVAENFPAVLVDLPTVSSKLCSAGAVMQITVILRAVPAELTIVTSEFPSIMPNINTPKICRSG